MRRIRILLAGMPRMLLDMITDIVALHARMMVAGTMQDMADIRAAVKKTRADVVILNEPAIGPPQDHQELLYSRPRLGVLSITSDGRQFFLHKLRPVRTALGEVSPDSLVQAIQSSAQRSMEVLMADVTRRGPLGGVARRGRRACRSVGSFEGAGARVRQPGHAAERGRQCDEPRQFDGSGPADPAIADQFPAAVRRRPPLRTICSSSGRRSTTRRNGSRTAAGHGR